MSAVSRVLRSGRDGRRDDGQILLLLLGYALIALVLVTVVASASSVHLQRKRLLAVADAAALDAADALDVATFYGPRGVRPGDGVPLTDASVREAVAEHLALRGTATGVNSLRVAAPTGTPDGVTAEVTLAAVAQVPLVSVVLDGWSDGVPLRVTARARTGLQG